MAIGFGLTFFALGQPDGEHAILEALFFGPVESITYAKGECPHFRGEL